MQLQEFRKQYPQYDDMNDDALAQALHKKYYSDIDYDEFSQRVGVKSESKPINVTANGKSFTFPEGTTNDQIGEAIDSFFSGQATPQHKKHQSGGVEADSKPTEEQLILGLRRADAAGDSVGANRFAELIKQRRSDRNADNSQPQIVDVVGVGEVEFPAGMSQDQIRGVLRSKFGDQSAQQDEGIEIDNGGNEPSQAKASNKIALLQEAERRGILPENKRALYDEAVKRGLIGDVTKSEQETVEQGQTNSFLSSLEEPFEGFNEGIQSDLKSDDSHGQTELSEIGDAPELNSLSVPAFKASLGLLTTGDTKSLRGIFKEQFGNDVSFEEVEGRTIVNLPSGQYELNSKGLSGQDIARFTAQALSFTPAGRASSIVKAVATNAATQTGIDAVEGELGGEGVNAEETITSGVLGGGFKTAEKAIGAAHRGLTGNVDEASQAIIKSGEDAGIKVLTSDVVQPKTFVGKNLNATAEKVPVIGTGVIREGQEELRRNAVDKVVSKYGEYSYATIVDSLKSQKDKIKKAAGGVLERTGNKLDEVGELSLTRTKEAISKSSEQLNKSNVLPSSEAQNALREISDTLLENPQTFSSLKENRTAFNELVKGLDKAERSQLGTRAKSLLENVSTAITRDLDEVANANLTKIDYNKWKRANVIYAKESQKLTKTKIKNVLDKGDFTPESVKQLLFSRNQSEVQLLYKSLTNEGRSNARAAVISDVVETLAKRPNGLSPNTFANELKKRGLQVDTFFKGREKKELTGLLRALEHTRRASEASVTTPTGQSLFTALGIVAGSINAPTTLGAGATIATAARVYESPAVRNILLRLGSVRQGSTQFEKDLLELSAALNSATQSASGEGL